MHDLTVPERAAVNSQLADVLGRWGSNADLELRGARGSNGVRRSAGIARVAPAGRCIELEQETVAKTIIPGRWRHKPAGEFPLDDTRYRGYFPIVAASATKWEHDNA